VIYQAIFLLEKWNDMEYKSIRMIYQAIFLLEKWNDMEYKNDISFHFSFRKMGYKLKKRKSI